MPEQRATPPDEGRKPGVERPQAGQPDFEELPFSPSKPPLGLHAKPLIKSRIDLAELRKALKRAGVDPDQ